MTNSTTKENRGAVITGQRDIARLVEVKEIPYPTLEDDMIILKTVASAVNPTDWKHIYPEWFVGSNVASAFRRFGLGFGSIEKPLAVIGNSIGLCVGKTGTWFQKGKVLGSDVVGIVEEVGNKVTKFKKGDIVGASLHGGISSDNGGFSYYVKVNDKPAILFPPSMINKEPLSPGKYPGTKINSFEAAASVPLGLKTVGLSLHYHLAIPPNGKENKDDYLLIWGGATATGVLAIQIAKLIYGIKVIATASEKNHTYLKSLGVDEVFSYRDIDVVEKIRKAGGNRIKYAMDCVSEPETLQSTYDATEGTENVVINNLLYMTAKSIYTKSGRNVIINSTDGYLTDGRVHFGKKALKEMMSSFQDFWENYLPTVLDKIETTSLQVLPPGLNSANEGLALLMDNKVSGKLVFRNREI